MKRDLVTKIKSSFLSCEKDTETILKKLFIEHQPHSDILKRLLVINTKDCLDENNSKYKEIVKNLSIKDLIEKGYIRTNPKIKMGEHEEIKTYVLLSFDNFFPSYNPEFRDCTVSFDIVCHTDYWDVQDFRLRPLQIAGYIDGILDNTKLSGIGEFQFLGCKELILNNDLAGYTLSYAAVHGSDDIIPGDAY